jgi:cell division protease FtsH
MVCEFGMSNLGPVHFGNNNQQVFLGRDISTQRETSEETARSIDNEVYRLIQENLNKARQIILDHRREMELLAQALLEYESVDTADVKELFETGKLSRPRPSEVLAAEAKTAEDAKAEAPVADPTETKPEGSTP